jgi:hypothetical protein
MHTLGGSKGNVPSKDFATRSELEGHLFSYLPGHATTFKPSTTLPEPIGGMSERNEQVVTTTYHRTNLMVLCLDPVKLSELSALWISNSSNFLSQLSLCGHKL